MRILTVADFFYPDVVGGSAVMSYQIMRELTRRGHEISVLTRQSEKAMLTQSTPGIQIHRYPFSTQQICYPLNVFRAEKTIRALLAEKPYDLINAHHASSGLAAAAFSRSYPFVFFFHGPWHKEAMSNDGSLKVMRPKFLIRKNIDRCILKRCTAVVGLSDYMLQEASEIHALTRRKFHKIPSGVDVDRFKPANRREDIRKKLSLPVDQVILLTVRRLAPRMGLENLIRAMAIVETMRNDVMLVIGGRGELQDQLNRLIVELGVKRTLLVGYIDDHDLSGYYQASDLFIMPSVALEGFGLSTLEALACGIPVLGTPTGGTPEILKEVLPDFILPGIEPQDIADGILRQIPHLQDVKLKTRVRRFAERFSWERITDSVETLFQELAFRK